MTLRASTRRSGGGEIPDAWFFSLAAVWPFVRYRWCKLIPLESDGCLVALTVFKTVVGSSIEPGWVRFLPSPAFIVGTAVADIASARLLNLTVIGDGPVCFLEKPRHSKEVIIMSREQILKLTSLSSCAG
jgi:hypothetical protein